MYTPMPSVQYRELARQVLRLVQVIETVSKMADPVQGRLFREAMFRTMSTYGRGKDKE